jgi:hypothetical protein
MTIFTIDSESNIAAHGSASEIKHQESEPFTSEKELAQLAAGWPGSRLLDVWNLSVANYKLGLNYRTL